MFSRGRNLRTRGRFNNHESSGHSSWRNQGNQEVDEFYGIDQTRDKQNGRKQGRGRDKHPPGLKGKEIGLWYARRQSEHRTPTLNMDDHEASAISSAIDGISFSFSKRFKSSQSVFNKPNTVRSHSSSECNEVKNFYSEVPGSNSTKFAVKDKNFGFCSSTGSDNVDEILNKIEESDFKIAYMENVAANKFGNQNMNEPKYKPKTKNQDLDRRLFEDLQLCRQTPRYNEMLKFRKRLPAYLRKEEIITLVQNNRVVLISGETGCGKTTQVSQFILDHEIENMSGSTCTIVCTQPRRISAISVAERIADERAEKIGSTVGYQIRLNSVRPRSNGSILYCTTGIVFQWLQSDPVLSNISHLILDEIHERDSLSDLLITIVKDLLTVRNDLKVILMSATMNAEKFSSYFNDCPTLCIPGKIFPVQVYYLEDALKFTQFSFGSVRRSNDQRHWGRRGAKESKAEKKSAYDIRPYLEELRNSGTYPLSVLSELEKENHEELNPELIISLLRYISTEPPGAVLVFAPGWDQISKIDKLIKKDRILGSNNFLVIPLHSQIAIADQRKVFDEPPTGIRKIVIATNIAETSITINDVVYVIDCGKIKMKNYDKKSNVATLLPEWVSRANARQRRGRAGRVKAGICFHLFTKARERLLYEFQLPELKRTQLSEVLLQLKILKLGSCKVFLSKVLDPPDPLVVDNAIKMLQIINAFDSNENLTPLGFHLAKLPMDPLTGKMILMGAIFSCLGPVLAVAASLSFKDPFVMSLGNEKVVDKIRREYSRNSQSDHIMVANVFNQWRNLPQREQDNFVYQNFLSSNILYQLKNMRLQFMDYLRDLKFVNSKNPDDDVYNLNSCNEMLVKAIITAGFYPNVAKVMRKCFGYNKGSFRGITLSGSKKPYINAAFHPKSVNSVENFFVAPWIVYWEKIKSSKVYIYDATLIGNYPLLLFGEKIDYDEVRNFISVDSFVKIKCDERIARVIQKLRNELDHLLDYKISHPGATNLKVESKESRLIKLIVEFISSERLDMTFLSEVTDPADRESSKQLMLLKN